MTRRRRARHAALIGSGRSRKTNPGAQSGSVRPPSKATGPGPSVDYRSAAGLSGVPTASDGHTVLMPAMRTVILPDPKAPARCTEETVTLAAVADVVTTGRWYGPGSAGDVDWPDNRADAPSLVAAPVMGPELSALSAKFDAVFGHSALRHRTGVDGIWFNTGESLNALWSAQMAQEAKDADHDRKVAGLNNYRKVTSGGRRTEGSLDTGIFATVVDWEFATTAGRGGAR